ncbi:hypothetical protein [Archangium sp.]|uniref:hypothetical protein n=1 Tax=Archangium sp. TaxID=1872627 RepID=UPI002D231F24|nr:hypothetical protein [Archangium sp.]HYO58138.1 hypothetical protein [Archangium sp.]
MQLRKMTLMLAALGVMSVVLTGCPDGGRESLTCSTNTDCLESEICHPDAKVCVQTCTTGTDCPESAKTCDALSPTNSQKICRCTTSELCARDQRVDGANLACSTTYNVCVPKCTANADCATGQTCDTTAGVCKPGSTTGNTCSGAGQSTCTYGEFCSATKCTAVPAPTCPNFNGKPAKNFDPTTGTGNIIYNVEKLIFGTQCGTDTTAQIVKARVSFYAKSGTLPTTKEGLNGFFYVTTSGNELNGVPLSNEYQRSADGKSAALSVNLCTDKDFSQIVLGFYFTGGNGYCATLTK